jgi:hypothetical protein
MSSAATAKLKGIKLGAEPRKVALLGLLLVGVIGVYIYNSSDTSSSTGSTGVTSQAPIPVNASPLTRPRAHKRAVKRNDHNTLRMQEVTVEAQQGQIDPTLRLDLLERLKSVKLTGGGRNLFEPGMPKAEARQITAAGPRIMPGPTAMQQAQAAAAAQAGMQAIPLKFFGFVAPASGNGPRRGFFLDGDDVLVVNEGDTVKGRYRIVSLDTKSAQVEDITANNKQVLSIVPEQQSGF